MGQFPLDVNDIDDGVEPVAELGVQTVVSP